MAYDMELIHAILLYKGTKSSQRGLETLGWQAIASPSIGTLGWQAMASSSVGTSQVHAVVLMHDG